jgi:protein-disulfide isomerase
MTEPQSPSTASPSPAPGGKTSPATILLGVLGFAATLALGFYGGRYVRETFFVTTELEQGDRYKVGLRGDEPQIGPDDALVTIIIFSDFQCPFCGKAAPELLSAYKSNDEDVRLIFKHYPLPGHQKAVPAAKAAWAAHQQGKFWEMHDWLFDHKSNLDGVQEHVKKLGLDVARFERDRDSEGATAAIDSDHLSGGKAGASGTPYFMVNGRPYSGMRIAKQWRDIIDHERKAAEALVKSGTPRAEVYAALLKDAKETRGGGAAVGGAPSKRPAARADGPDPAKRYRVLADDRPQKGPDDALITIVEFSDFQCPFCRQVNDTLAIILNRYGGDVRLVFRQRPLNFHREARGAAKAALAAGRQGKFWEMHDKLFAEQKTLNAGSYKLFAEVLGLDLARFESDMNDPAIEAMIGEDEAIAGRFGANGTPAFFINGRPLSGAMPVDAFVEVIEEELTVARAQVGEGVPRGEVLGRVMADALDSFAPKAQ